MTELEIVERKIEQTKELIRPLNAELNKLIAKLRKMKSKQWIETNEVTRDQIEMSSGDDRPWFGHVGEFVKWLKQRRGILKRFAEWNGRIYLTADLLAGRFSGDAPGCVDDLAS